MARHAGTRVRGLRRMLVTFCDQGYPERFAPPRLASLARLRSPNPANHVTFRGAGRLRIDRIFGVEGEQESLLVGQELLIAAPEDDPARLAVVGDVPAETGDCEHRFARGRVGAQACVLMPLQDQ